MVVGNNQQVNLILRQFKDDDGNVDYPVVLRIPLEHRIAEMAKKDFMEINMLIIGALTVAFENMNLKRGMNEIQILNLSEMLIDQSKEDNLALEDLMLFLQNMISGKYDMSYESMDVPKFMKMFEIYREERYQGLVQYRETQHLEYKSMGPTRTKESENPLDIHLSSFSNKLEKYKDELKEQKDINKRLQKDF